MRTWMNSLAAFASLLLLAVASVAGAQAPSSVLVVANKNNTNSRSLASYYMSKRGIPSTNLLTVSWLSNDNSDTISQADYVTKIATPIYNKIAALKKNSPHYQIDYIVLCRNLPVCISDNGNSVDSMLVSRSVIQASNPYYQVMNTPFRSATYGIYLVTRLDGWSWKDAYSLVDRAKQAVRTTGPFAFDCDPTKESNYDYWLFDFYLQLTVNSLASSGYTTLLDTTNDFLDPAVPLMGYVSWGSNDSSFNADTFNSLQFLPGALVETAVSTSASNLRYPGGSQSQIAQLIHNGVTGIKGYVSEPGISATAVALILFPNYTSGRNLAESFYSASSLIGWKDVVIGDPLCKPYRP